jgi:CrcB protein
MMLWLAVALGGALGTLARQAVNILFGHFFARQVPYATATVNIVGAAIIGLLAGLMASGRLDVSPAVRTFAFVGVLGGFTTFSSFMLDTLALAHGADQGLAFANIAGQTAFGVAAVWAGYHLGLTIG